VASITTASAAFVLSGVIALVLAVLSDDVRLQLGGIAAASGALALGLLRLDRRPGRGQSDPEADEE
jgi:membrane protein implicated in regulation of membrane protease activity